VIALKKNLAIIPSVAAIAPAAKDCPSVTPFRLERYLIHIETGTDLDVFARLPRRLFDCSPI
jgi:hypothetical protein